MKGAITVLLLQLAAILMTAVSLPINGMELSKPEIQNSIEGYEEQSTVQNR